MLVVIYGCELEFDRQIVRLSSMLTRVGGQWELRAAALLKAVWWGMHLASLLTHLLGFCCKCIYRVWLEKASPQPFYGPFSGTEADTPTIWLGAIPSGLTSAHLHHSSILLQAGCPSCCQTNSVKVLKATKKRLHSPRAGSGAVSKWVICACDSLVDFGTV